MALAEAGRVAVAAEELDAEGRVSRRVERPCDVRRAAGDGRQSDDGEVLPVVRACVCVARVVRVYAVGREVYAEVLRGRAVVVNLVTEYAVACARVDTDAVLHVEGDGVVNACGVAGGRVHVHAVESVAERVE